MLRTRIRFILILLLSGLVLTVYFHTASLRAQKSTFDQHDLAMAHQNMQRVISIFWSHLEDLDRTVPDWSYWDDTRDFASGVDTAYVEDNLMESTFVNLRIDSFIILGRDGKPVYSLSYDHGTESLGPVPASLLTRLSSSGLTGDETGEPKVRRALLSTPEGPVALAYAPILTSNMEGPSAGTLVMTRMISEDFLAGVSNVAQVDLHVFSNEAQPDEAMPEEIAGSLHRTDPVQVRVRDQSLIEGYALLAEGQAGHPLLLTATLPRPMKTAGTSPRATAAFVLLLVTLLVACAAVVLVERLLLSRLGSLSDQVADVEKSRRVTGTMFLAGRDELAMLSQRINRMLQSLSAAQEEVRNRENQLKDALREKELLLKELHHRVKNNLHAVSSLFGARIPLVKDRAAMEALRQSQHFVLSMALIHQQLHESISGSGIDFGRYLEKLSRILLHGYGKNQDVEVRLDVDEAILNPDTALPMGLVANELITNCLKHAFPDGKKGRIGIRLQSLGEGVFQMDVNDNGVGLGERGDDTVFSSFGLLMVEGVIDQLGGRMVVQSGDDGLKTTVTFRLYSECPSMGL